MSDVGLFLSLHAAADSIPDTDEDHRRHALITVQPEVASSVKNADGADTI